jgi:hypothetical protein
VDVAAILVLFLTVMVGMVVLGLWAEPVRTKTDRRSVVLATFHILAALAAVTLWLVFAVGQADVIGWLGLAVLATTILLGASTLISSRAAERSPPLGDSPKPVSPVALIAHGGLAAVATAFALAALVAR